VQALGLIPGRGRELVWEIARIIQYVTQLFIVVGILGLIASWRKTRFYPEFAVLGLVSIVIIAMCIILPHFAAKLNMSRIYHITLFCLAPFCILGGIATFRWLSGMVRLHRLGIDHTLLKLVLILVVVPYFLFTTGFIFELTGATPTSPALSLYKADWRYFTQAEMHASTWLARMPKDRKIYSDRTSGALLYYGGAGEFERGILHSDIEMDDDSYIFLRRWNVTAGEVLVATTRAGESPRYENLEEIELLKSSRVAKIYDSGEAQVLLYRK